MGFSLSNSDIPSDSNSIEQITPGNTVETRYSKRVFIYTLTDFSKPAPIDAYYDRVIQDMLNLPKGADLLFVYDVSAIPLTWTPHIRKRSNELIQAGRTLKGGRVALIFHKSIFLHFIRVFIEWQQKRFFPHVETHIFFDRQEGIAWVEAGLEDARDSSS